MFLSRKGMREVSHYDAWMNIVGKCLEVTFLLLFAVRRVAKSSSWNDTNNFFMCTEIFGTGWGQELKKVNSQQNVESLMTPVTRLVSKEDHIVDRVRKRETVNGAGRSVGGLHEKTLWLCSLLVFLCPKEEPCKSIREIQIIKTLNAGISPRGHLLLSVKSETGVSSLHLRWPAGWAAVLKGKILAWGCWASQVSEGTPRSVLCRDWSCAMKVRWA